MTRPLPPEPPAELVAYEVEPGKVLFVHPLPKHTLPGLTATEEEILTLVLDGWDNASIASARKTAPRTVANQVASIFRKVGVSSRAELVAKISAAASAAAPRE